MAIIKHKLFFIPIDEGTIIDESENLSTINKFLEEDNNVYLNHSITTILTSQVNNVAGNTNPSFNRFKTQSTLCVISLVYQDLKGTKDDLSKLTEKSKKVVQKSIKSKINIPKPDFTKTKKDA